MATEKPRMYGNPVLGTQRVEDVTLCIDSVIGPERWASAHQCSRKRGHGPDGLHCGQHAKLIRQRIDSAEKWNREMKAQREERKLEKELGRLLQGDAVFLYAMEQMAADLYNCEYQPRVGYPAPPDSVIWVKAYVKRELDEAKKVRIKP